MELTYRTEGDYRLPNLEAPEAPKVGKYGMLRRSYLQTHRNAYYTGMLLSGRLERPSGEDRPAGHGDGGAVDGADGAGAGRDGGVEGQRSDEVGGPDEQHPGSSGGSGTDRAGLRGHISGPLIAGEELPQAPVDGTSATAGLQNSHHDLTPARTSRHLS